MRELTVTRAGPMTPLELQLRRVETRTAFLVLELEKLLELADQGGRLTDEQADHLASRIEPVGDLIIALVRRHAAELPPPDPELVLRSTRGR